MLSRLFILKVICLLISSFVIQMLRVACYGFWVEIFVNSQLVNLVSSVNSVVHVFSLFFIKP